MTPTPSYTKDLDGKSPPVQIDTDTLSDVKDAAIAHGSAFMSHVKEDVKEMALSVEKGAQHKYEAIKEFADGYLSRLQKHVVARPMQSLAIAAAAGALISIFMRRR
jgi:ElaB/YqjD/DUF883 family membrane-anchored ribosome-binding protein